MATGYNDRLQADSYGLKAADNSQIMSKNYEYYADGALRYAQDALNPVFNRLSIYDHAGASRRAERSRSERHTCNRPAAAENQSAVSSELRL
jgi:hypothetical protein